MLEPDKTKLGTHQADVSNRIRRPPIRAQTAKEIVDQDQEAGLGTEKIRVNEDLAHMPAPVFRPIGQRHSLQRDHREKMAAGGENRVGVACDPAQSMRSCIDAALKL